MEGFAEVDGGRLYYEAVGAGPPVVLVHPGLWDSRIWDGQMEPLARQHRVVRYDLRGYGRSDRPSQPFSPRRDLADVMAALDISSAVVVGGSIGGALAIDFALEFPWLVDGLVLVAPGLSGDDTPDDERTAGLLDMAEAALAAGDLERAVAVQLQAWTPLRTDALAEDRIRSIALDNKHVDTLDWSLSQRLDPPAAGRLAEIRAPTLVIIGDEDAAVMSAIASAIVNGIDGARSVEIQDADHLPNMRQPKRFNDVVLGFLDEVVAAQGAR